MLLKYVPTPTTSMPNFPRSRPSLENLRTRLLQYLKAVSGTDVIIIGIKKDGNGFLLVPNLKGSEYRAQNNMKRQGVGLEEEPCTKYSYF